MSTDRIKLAVGCDGASFKNYDPTELFVGHNGELFVGHNGASFKNYVTKKAIATLLQSEQDRSNLVDSNRNNRIYDQDKAEIFKLHDAIYSQIKDNPNFEDFNIDFINKTIESMVISVMCIKKFINKPGEKIELIGDNKPVSVFSMLLNLIYQTNLYRIDKDVIGITDEKINTIVLASIEDPESEEIIEKFRDENDTIRSIWELYHHYKLGKSNKPPH